MGDKSLLGRYLKYADVHLNPTWENGGFFYPRNDRYQDENGRIVMMSPCAGNALLPYARLNVPSGIWTLYNKPWTQAHFSEPLITTISDNLDLSRAMYLKDRKVLVFTTRYRQDGSGDGKP